MTKRIVSSKEIASEICEATGKPHEIWHGYTGGDTWPQFCVACDTVSNEFPPCDHGLLPWCKECIDSF